MKRKHKPFVIYQKPFVIYQMFWLGRRWRKWTEYETAEEAVRALADLQASPSGKHYAYELRERGLAAKESQ